MLLKASLCSHSPSLSIIELSSKNKVFKCLRKHIKINTLINSEFNRHTITKKKIMRWRRSEILIYLGDDVNCISWIAFSKPAFYFLKSNNANSRTNQIKEYVTI